MSVNAHIGTVSKEKMHIFEGWDGIWEGQGWSADQSQQKFEFTVKETIRKKVNGHAYLAEGIGTKISTVEVGFQSLGDFYYNNEKQTYEIKSFLDDGKTSLSTGKLTENGDLVWGFDVPGGTIKYTFSKNGNQWKETGEFTTQDGENTFPLWK